MQSPTEHPATTYGAGLEKRDRANAQENSPEWSLHTGQSKTSHGDRMQLRLCVFPHPFVLRDRFRLFLDLIGELPGFGWEDDL